MLDVVSNIILEARAGSSRVGKIIIDVASEKIRLGDKGRRMAGRAQWSQKFRCLSPHSTRLWRTDTGATRLFISLSE
jgi:hypothetical protein